MMTSMAAKSEPRFTKAFDLPAAALISTAAADIRRSLRNRGIAAGTRERLGFFPADVRGCTHAYQVLVRAYRRAKRFAHLKEIPKQKNRALLYGDVARLADAVTIAKLRHGLGE